MSKSQIIEAWRNAEKREGLDPSAMPSSPAGLLQLSEDDLEDFAGGATCNNHSCCWTTLGPDDEENA
jgi:mersacidin/lichenicidin family type 2 lantibiotic